MTLEESEIEIMSASMSPEEQSNNSSTTTKEQEESADEDSASRKSSSCTVVDQIKNRNSSHELILHPSNLPQVSSSEQQSTSCDRVKSFVEIQLSEESSESDTGQSSASSNQPQIEMRNQHQLEEQPSQSPGAGGGSDCVHKFQQPQSGSRGRRRSLCGMSEQETKLAFRSKRMKEYFESLRSHRNESKRLYQFFKCCRTELVACLLFTLITSQALISSRLYLEPNQQLGQLHSNAASELQSRRSGQNNAQVQLASGLIMSMSVASLTQVFGHISGCHLLPSVSLALYLKEHISRARLASYLAAQSVGSLVGVSLLSLLTSSQITGSEYDQLVAGLGKQSMSFMGQPAGGDTRRVARSRRSPNSTTTTSNVQTPADDDINLNELQQVQGSSETILLSIMEQQRSERPSKAPITLESSTFSQQQPEEGQKVDTQQQQSSIDASSQSRVEQLAANASQVSKKLVMRRTTRRRNRRQQQQVADQQNANYYLNLLELALPEPIMSSDSIRQCISRQAATADQPLAELAKQSLLQCLSLSNWSQMFVFQVLATLLVVLTYLVNVDPRRVDSGFKSLSIGLSYFVACALTVSSTSQPINQSISQ